MKNKLLKEISALRRSIVLNRNSDNFEKAKEDHLKRELIIKKAQLNKLPAESEGLGDTIKKVTDKLGIKQCGGCKKRQENSTACSRTKKTVKKKGEVLQDS